MQGTADSICLVDLFDSSPAYPILIREYLNHQWRHNVNKFKFHRVADVLFLAVLLLGLGGCVTSNSGEQGSKFFTTESWNEFEDNTAKALRKGKQTLTVSEVQKLVPAKPVMTRQTTQTKVYGWFYARSGNFIWDFGVYGNTKSVEDGRFLAVQFTADGILYDFEFQTVKMPSRNRYFTSKPIVDEGVTYLHYTILSNLMGKQMDKSLERSENRFVEKAKNVLNTDGADLVNKAKDAIDGLNTGSLPDSLPIGTPASIPTNSTVQ